MSNPESDVTVDGGPEAPAVDDSNTHEKDSQVDSSVSVTAHVGLNTEQSVVVAVSHAGHELPPPQPIKTSNLFLGVVASIAFVWFLRESRFVMLPFVLAMFLTLLIKPLQDVLDRYMPNWLSSGITLVGLLAVLAGAGSFLVVSVNSLAADLPLYAARIDELTSGFVEWLGRRGLDVNPAEMGPGPDGDFLLSFVSDGLKNVFSVVGFTLLVGFMMVLNLLEMRHVQPKIRLAFQARTQAELIASLEKAVDQFKTYFFAKTVMSIITGVLTGLLCFALGVKFAFIFGMLAFLLNYLPNLGSIVAGILPALFAYLQGDTLTFSFAVLGGLTTIQLVIGNFLDPRLMGRSLALSPMVVFVSMVFWGWVWGFMGVFLAIPMTLGIRIACQNVPALRPIAILMGDGTTRDTTPIDEEDKDAADGLSVVPT